MDENSNSNAAEAEVIATPANIEDLKPKMKVKGTVKRLELYGAFIDIGLDVNALIHISKLGNEHVNRVTDVLKEGDEVTVWVEKVQPERKQVMVSMIEPLEVEWNDLQKNQVYTGTVKRLENYGAFVDIGAEREGLVHISELSHNYVKQPSEVVSVGDEVQVQVLGFSKRKRRIDLSMKSLQEKPASQVSQASAADIEEYVEDEVGEMPTAMEYALRKALGDDIDEFVEERGRKGRKGGKKRRRRDRRNAQDDLLNRTLELQSES